MHPMLFKYFTISFVEEIFLLLFKNSFLLCAIKWESETPA